MIKIKKRFFYLLLGIVSALLFISLADCSKDKKKETEKKGGPKIAVARKESTALDLFYRGSLNPIKTISVLSPIDGHVSQMLFRYGSAVKKGQALLKLSSSELTEDYRQKVSDFLQKKDALLKSKQSLTANQALYKAGVISKEDLTNAQSTYQNDALSYYQSSNEMQKVLKKAGMRPEQVANLSLSDVKTIQGLFQHSLEDVTVASPGDGVALFPTDKSSDQGGGKSQLSLGAEVKTGQLLMSLGDLTGFSIEVPVSEINVDQIHPNQAAVVTGDAFPGITLDGYVSYVAYQATPQDTSGGGGGGSTVSSFTVRINIPKVEHSQLKTIHVGMTAQIKISIQNPAKILIPIAAMFEKNGKTTVTKYDPKTGHETDITVLTGETTGSEVTIIKGINEGDSVVLRH